MHCIGVSLQHCYWTHPNFHWSSNDDGNGDGVIGENDDDDDDDDDTWGSPQLSLTENISYELLQCQAEILSPTFTMGKAPCLRAQCLSFLILWVLLTLIYVLLEFMNYNGILMFSPTSTMGKAPWTLNVWVFGGGAARPMMMIGITVSL